MGKKNNSPLPGGNTDPAKVEAAKAEQKQRERVNIFYRIFRCIYERQCIYLGVEEVATLTIDEGGIIPRVVPQVFEEDQKDRRDEFMRNKLKDFYAMTKEGGGQSLLHEAIQFMQQEIEDLEALMQEVDTPPPNAAGLVGTDGVPLDAAKQENLQGESTKE